MANNHSKKPQQCFLYKLDHNIQCFSKIIKVHITEIPLWVEEMRQVRANIFNSNVNLQCLRECFVIFYHKVDPIKTTLHSITHCIYYFICVKHLIARPLKQIRFVIILEMRYTLQIWWNYQLLSLNYSEWRLSPCHIRAASSRRLHGVQENVGMPRCPQWDLLERRRIAVASLWHLHWTPWGLPGRHATSRILCMHKVRAVARCSHCDLNERCGNAVAAQ